MCIFIIGIYVTYDKTICDLGDLGEFISVDEKKVLVTLMISVTWKRRPVLLGMPLIHFILLGTLTRCHYSWDFSVLGHTTALKITGCRVRLSFCWSITAQFSLAGLTRGVGFMGAAVGVLMVVIWFAMRCYTCIFVAQ